MKCVTCDNPPVKGSYLCADCIEKRHKARTQLTHDMAIIKDERTQQLPPRLSWRILTYVSLIIIVIMLMILWRYQ